MSNVKLRCPICRQLCTYENNLCKHMQGLKPKGHEIEPSLFNQWLPALRLHARGKESFFDSKEFKEEYHVFLSREETPEMNGKVDSVDLESLRTSYSDITIPAPVPDDDNGTFLEILFKLLTWNKRIPKYQFERRIDIFINFFMADILSVKFGGKFEFVVPELPLKLEHSNQSTNFDYLYFRHSPQEEWWIIELKTDSGSVNMNQFGRYLDARKSGMPHILQDIVRIDRASKSNKYRDLICRLNQFPADRPVKPLYLVPDKRCLPDHSAVEVVEFRDLLEMKVDRFAEEWELLQKSIFQFIK